MPSSARSHQQTLVAEIADCTKLRAVLPRGSEPWEAARERERELRLHLALTPEHQEAQAHWRALGDWLRTERQRRSAARLTAPSELNAAS